MTPHAHGARLAAANNDVIPAAAIKDARAALP
jgi:hypothetical protein